MATAKSSGKSTPAYEPMTAPANQASTRTKSPGGKVCSGISIRRAKNGFTASKNYEGKGGEYFPSEDHVFASVEDVAAFVTKSLS